MKVIDLMGAIKQGADIKRVEYDSHPLKFVDPGTGTAIDVHTDDNSYSGPTTLFEGLVKSDNTVYQQLDLDLTPKVVTKTAHDMGVISHFDNYPSEGLGGFTRGVTPLEMGVAYATVASHGGASLPDRDHQGRVPRRSRRPQDRPPEGQADLHRRPDRPGDPGDARQHRARDRHRRELRLRFRSGQDRHDLELHRRVVQRLRPGARDRRLGRVSEVDDLDGRRARLRRDVRRPGPGRHLAHVHEHRRPVQAVAGDQDAVRRRRSSPAATCSARATRACDVDPAGCTQTTPTHGDDAHNADDQGQRHRRHEDPALDLPAADPQRRRRRRPRHPPRRRHRHRHRRPSRRPAAARARALVAAWSAPTG